MKIKAFGCSFIWGSELSDEIPQRRFSDLTWPAVLAKKLELHYECFARPGVGNLYIADQVISQAINTVEPALFVINWTYIDRFDYVAHDSWDSILPGDQTDLGKFYYSNLHSEFRDKLTNLLQIYSVVNLLKSKNISFIMTSIDPIMLDQTWHVTPAVIELQRFINENLTKFDQTDFLTWAKDKGHTLSAMGHLLDLGHLHVFREIEKYIKLKTITTLTPEVAETFKQKLKELKNKNSRNFQTKTQTQGVKKS
jgi:hypothetical protein